MTSLQTSDPKIDDNHPSMGIDWPSDGESHSILDDSCSEQQSPEEPHPEIRSPAEEVQETPAENLQPARNASPRLVDGNASTPNPVGSNVSPPSEPLLQISPGTDAMGTECGSKPLLTPEQEREAQLKFLRYKLQKGFLPEGQQPSSGNMKEMSLYLKKLEKIEIPSRIIADDTRIRKVLKKVLNLDQIPRDGKFSFKERVARLLEKWKENWEKEEPITASSTAQPISDHGSELNAIPDDWGHISSPDTQQLLENEAEASAIGFDLMEDIQPEIVAESELSRKPTSDHSIELRSEIPLDSNQPIPCNIFEDSASSLSDMSGSSTKKRKWSDDTTSDRSSPVSDSDAGRSDLIYPGNLQGLAAAVAKPINENKPTNGRKQRKTSPRQQRKTSPRQQRKTSPRQQRKTSPRQHLDDEMSWMNESVRRIDVMLVGIQEELKANIEKGMRLIEENIAEQKTIMKRRDELVELKSYQLAWGAQDEKVTDEWEPSE